MGKYARFSAPTGPSEIKSPLAAVIVNQYIANELAEANRLQRIHLKTLRKHIGFTAEKEAVFDIPDEDLEDQA